jgi:hypothetical protein
MVKQLSFDEVASVLTECMRSLAGNHAPSQIDPNVSALRQWGLESEDGVDLAADLGIRLGIEIPHDENPLVEENGPTGQKRARSFENVVQYVMNYMASPPR